MASAASLLPIEKSVIQSETYPSVTERYYIPHYSVDVNGNPGEDQCILFHSNKICVITLAPSHPVLKEKKQIAKIDFQVSAKVNRLENKVSGKGKHGAQALSPSSVLCYVKCTDDSQYTVCSCIKGKLVEINEQLIDKPNLVLEKPWSEGYIAIVLPNLATIKQQQHGLMPQDEYKNYVQQRQA